MNPANVLLQQVHAGQESGDRSQEPGKSAPHSSLLAPLSFIPKIADFGLAKRLDDASGLTQTGAVLGTPSYMAPEQAEGRHHDIGPGTDVYALGAILYEMLTGRPPFKGATFVETIDQVRTAEPVPPGRLQNKTPPDLETICLKCLEKNAGKRYPSAGALADDIECFLQRKPIQARPASLRERTVKWAKRRPVAAALLAVCLGAGLSLLALGVQLWRTNHDLDDTLAAVKTEAFNTGQFLYAADMRLVHQQWLRGDIPAMLPLLERHQPKAGQPDRRGFEWHYLKRLAASSEPWTLRAHHGAVLCVAYAPDGQILATADEYGDIFLWDLTTRSIRAKLTGHAGAVRRLTFLADGKTLTSFGADRLLRLWDVGAGTEKGRIAKAGAGDMLLSPNGSWLAAAFDDDSIKIWDLSNAKAATLLHQKDPRYDGSVHDLAFSPNCEGLAASVGRDTIRQWHLTNAFADSFYQLGSPGVAVAYSPSGSCVAVAMLDGSVARFAAPLVYLDSIAGPPRTAQCLALSPGDYPLATGGEDGCVRVWLHQGNVPKEVFRGHSGRICAVAFAPDGQTLASAGADGTVKLWPLGHGQDAQPLQTPLVSAGAFAVSGDGRTVAVSCADAKVHLVDVGTARTRAVLPHGNQTVITLAAMAAAGDTLALAGDKGLKVWNITSGQELASLPLPDGTRCLAVAPDGRSVAVNMHNGETRVWEAASLKQRVLFPPNNAWSYALAFSRDGSSLATATDDAPPFRWWDIRTGAERMPRSEFPRANAFNLALSHDGRLAAIVFNEKGTSYEACDVVVWDMIKNERLFGFSTENKRVMSVAFSPDDKTLAVSQGDAVKLWDVPSGTARVHWRAHTHRIDKVAFTPDGRTLVTSCGIDGTVKFWDLKTFEFRQPEGQPVAPVHALTFSPDGQTLIVAGGNMPHKVFEEIYLPTGTRLAKTERLQSRTLDDVTLWNTSDGAARAPLAKISGLGARCLALTPDGQTILTGSVGGTIRLRNLSENQAQAMPLFATAADRNYWEVIERGKALKLISPNYSEAVRAVAVSPNGKWFATASAPERVQLWDLATRQVRHVLDKHAEVACVAFTRDGAKLAANDGGHVQFWDVVTGRKLERLEAHKTALTCLAFSADGAMLATAAKDRQVRLWNMASLVKKGDLIGHTDDVAALAFSPDNKTLASAGRDGSVRLWHTWSAQAMATLERHSGVVHALAFSPDGQTLVSGGESSSDVGEVFFWRTRK